MDEPAIHRAQGAPEPCFVAAAWAGRGSAAALGQALRSVRGVRSVRVELGLAEPGGPAPRRAIVAIAVLERPRRAVSVGAALARALASGAAPSAITGLGVAASLDGRDAPLETLVAVALEGARVVRPGTARGPSVCHSELYELESRRRAPAFAADGGDPAPSVDGEALVPASPPATRASRETHIAELVARADAALVDQLRAEAAGLRAEIERLDRAARRGALEGRLREVTARLEATEAPLDPAI